MFCKDRLTDLTETTLQLLRGVTTYDTTTSKGLMKLEQHIWVLICKRGKYEQKKTQLAGEQAVSFAFPTLPTGFLSSPFTSLGTSRWHSFLVWRHYQLSVTKTLRFLATHCCRHTQSTIQATWGNIVHVRQARRCSRSHRKDVLAETLALTSLIDDLPKLTTFTLVMLHASSYWCHSMLWHLKSRLKRSTQFFFLICGFPMAHSSALFVKDYCHSKLYTMHTSI